MGAMGRVRVRVEGHYEVEETGYGKDYVWTPAHALLECDCGRVLDADAENAVCPGCGADHSALVREVSGRHLSEDVLHPWHSEYDEWVRYKENRSEYLEWLEQREL